MSYHQGITWTWLLGLYYDTLKNMIKSEKRKTYKAKLEIKLEEFVTKTIKTFEKEVNQRGCIGSISEIYDSVKPFEPKRHYCTSMERCRNFENVFLGT